MCICIVTVVYTRSYADKYAWIRIRYIQISWLVAVRIRQLYLCMLHRSDNSVTRGELKTGNGYGAAESIVRHTRSCTNWFKLRDETYNNLMRACFYNIRP